jgi:hypothetical protein
MGGAAGEGVPARAAIAADARAGTTVMLSTPRSLPLQSRACATAEPFASRINPVPPHELVMHVYAVALHVVGESELNTHPYPMILS